MTQEFSTNGPVLVEHLAEPSIHQLEPTEVNLTENEPTWVTPIVKFLRDGVLPEDMKEARKLKV